MQLYTRIKYVFISRILNFKRMIFKLVSGAKTRCIIILTALHGRLTTYTYLHKQSNSSISHGIRKPKDSTAHNRIAQIKYWHSKGSSTWMLHRGKTITKHITIIKWRKPALGKLDLKSKSKTSLSLHKATDTQSIYYFQLTKSVSYFFFPKFDSSKKFWFSGSTST